MVDRHPAQTAKGFFKNLKKVFRPGSQSTPHSRPTTPPADLAPTITTSLVEAAILRAKYTHFRILVIGRANAGKTTLLKRVCNTEEDPVYSKINPTSKRGIHNVYDELSFKSCPGIIFHDSPGFEAGGDRELQDVLSFLQEKAKAKEVNDQIHAIWFCFTLNVSRPLLALEQMFFNEQLGWNVPVVAIFTKFDDLIMQVYDMDKEHEENREVACATLENKFEKPLKGYKFPPRAYVRLESMHDNEGNHQEQVGELIKQTALSIDDLALKMLFVSAQQINLEICIEYAMNKYIFKSASTVENMIHTTVSWFGHCYIQNDLFVDNVQGLVNTRYNVPSLCSFIAVLVCLEHSFLIAQQSSNPNDSFTKAWKSYFETQRALVDQELDDYLRSKDSNDWFTVGHFPSDEECAECRNIVFNNLL